MYKNNPADVISSWVALEVLSPQTFTDAENLAGANGSIARFNKPQLPWEEGEKPPHNQRLYYQVVIETIDFEKAVKALLNIYADKRVDPPAVRGEAVLATLLLDRKGLLAESPAVAVSSFGWGVPQALAGNLHSLSAWPEMEEQLVEDLDKIFRRTDKNGNEIAVDAPTLASARDWLIQALGLPTELLKNNSFAIRTYQYYTSQETPDTILLNSFFIGDLVKAATLFKQGKAPQNLQLYVGAKKPANRRDLLNNKEAFEQSLSPASMPPARWPGAGRHPLVALQQAAVNLTLCELKSEGILAVNGPPGTGKTTLLRDVVAAIVAERAEVMCNFNDPADAFINSGEKLSAGQAWLTLYEIDNRLKGFEMLITSSNNKAVENVSAELPGIKAIAEDADNLRYFTCLSDTILKRESWGLIAAVLGNAANRSAFRQAFWWHDDVGLSTYLAVAANGVVQEKEFRDQTTGLMVKRVPRIVSEENAPLGHEEALLRWQTAREKFRVTLSKSRETLSWLENKRQTTVTITPLQQALTAARESQTQLQREEKTFQDTIPFAERSFEQSRNTLTAAESRLAQSQKQRPGFFARLFGSAEAKQWKTEHSALMEMTRQSQSEYDITKLHLSDVEKRAGRLRQEIARIEREINELSSQYAKAEKEIREAKDLLGPHFIDDNFMRLPHAERHLVSPWCNKEMQQLRDDVFVAAVQLHKAFIDAAAKPLRHNLGALMMVFAGKKMPDEKKQDLLPDLWSSLFLVVPTASTTFASVERMLGSLPPQSLGWLLIDEAGQALPQAAVGALMRTKKAIVVGDPIQIPPVVVLPDTLTKNLCRQFDVDPDPFNAPEASTQTLADSATPYFAEFESRFGSRSVGVPLLVHRRCADPMFSIANAIAYEQLMVQAKRPAPSPIRDLLGPSHWIDVQGQAKEKWCPEEGEMVLSMLKQLRSAKVRPDLYIVTPFVVVAENLRKEIRNSRVLEGWVDNQDKWPYEHVGTVHTVQGREDEALIFVLGAPSPQQNGARGWAGGTPNLPNVAVTRAKEVLYVVGNRQLWQAAGLFREVSNRLP